MRWMMRMAVLLLSCTASAVAAMDAVPAHESFPLASTAMHETRPLNVYLPPGYEVRREERYPVLYLLDGGLREDFPQVAATADRLIRSGQARPFLIVGIENTVRRRDMTGPTQTPADLKVTAEPGGSGRLRKFLQTELQPAIRARYRTSDERALIGESLAGLFVVETVLRAPELFQTYVALDPSLWWNDGFLIKSAPASLGALKGRPLHLLLYSGGPESNVLEVEKWVGALRNAAPASLRWQYVARPDLRHDNLYRNVLSQVLLTLYGTSRQASAVQSGG